MAADRIVSPMEKTSARHLSTLKGYCASETESLANSSGAKNASAW